MMTQIPMKNHRRPLRRLHWFQESTQKQSARCVPHLANPGDRSASTLFIHVSCPWERDSGNSPAPQHIHSGNSHMSGKQNKWTTTRLPWQPVAGKTCSKLADTSNHHTYCNIPSRHAWNGEPASQGLTLIKSAIYLLGRITNKSSSIHMNLIRREYQGIWNPASRTYFMFVCALLDCILRFTFCLST